MLKRFAAGLVALALVATPAAAANVSGWYAGIYAGSSHSGEIEFGYDEYMAQLFGPGPIETPTSYVNDGIDPHLFDFLNEGPEEYPFASDGIAIGILTDGMLQLLNSPALGVVVGYGLGNGVRIEGDVSGASFRGGLYTTTALVGQDVDGLMGATGIWTWSLFDEADGPIAAPGPLRDLGFTYRTDVQFFLVNAFYDIDLGAAFMPYLGGGVGVARITSTLDDDCGCVTGTMTRLAPAAQLGAGVRIAVSDPVSLDIGYRYKVTGDEGFSAVSEFFGPFGNYSASAVHTSGIIGVHTLQAGLTFALP